MTGLTRFDYGSTHGWFARHYEDGQVTSRLYSDRCYGDPEAARQAAQAFLAQLAQQRHPRVPFRTRLSRRNRTGVIGVCLRRKREKNGASLDGLLSGGFLGWRFGGMRLWGRILARWLPGRRVIPNKSLVLLHSFVAYFVKARCTPLTAWTSTESTTLK